MIVKLRNDIFDTYDREVLIAEIMNKFQDNAVEATTLMLVLDTELSDIDEIFGRKRPQWYELGKRRKWNRDAVILKMLIREAIDRLQEGEGENGIEQLIIRQLTE